MIALPTLSRRLALAVLLIALPANAQQAERAYAVTDGKTPGGIRLVQIELQGEPDQALTFHWPDGWSRVEPGKAALISLAPGLIVRGGSVRLDGGAFEEDMKDLGASFRLDRNSAYSLGEVMAPKAAIAEAMEHFGDLMAAPRLPERQLRRLAQGFVAAVRESREAPASLAATAMSMLLFNDSPLGALFTFEPPEPLVLFGVDDVRAWHGRVIARDTLTVTAAGPQPRAELEAMIDKAFAALPTRATLAEARPLLLSNPGKTVVIERPVEQTSLILAAPTEWASGEEGLPRSIAMAVLGGGSSSRLHRAVREKLGATYGAQASIMPFDDTFFRFAMTASVANDRVPVALAAIRAEYQRFRAEGISESEAEGVRGRIAAQQRDVMRKAMSAAATLRAGLVAGLGAEAPNTFHQRLNAASAERVNALIRRHLPENLTTVIVAPSAEGLGADCVIRSLADIKTCR